MKLQRGKWLRIVAYSDFNDIPHRILLLDRHFVFWLLDCPFDPATDDYATVSSVYRIGHDASMAGSRFHSTDDQPAPDERIPAAHLEFDETRRNALFVHANSR